MASEQMLRLSHDEWGQFFLKDLNTMRLEEYMCDTKILLAGEEVINAHSCVLAAASPFFKSVLGDTQYPEVDMAEFPGDLVKQVVEFIYTGEILVSKAEVPFLHSIAETLSLYVLIEISREVINSLDVDHIEGDEEIFIQHHSPKSVSNSITEGHDLDDAAEAFDTSPFDGSSELMIPESAPEEQHAPYNKPRSSVASTFPAKRGRPASKKDSFSALVEEISSKEDSLPFPALAQQVLSKSPEKRSRGRGRPRKVPVVQKPTRPSVINTLPVAPSSVKQETPDNDISDLVIETAGLEGDGVGDGLFLQQDENGRYVKCFRAVESRKSWTVVKGSVVFKDQPVPDDGTVSDRAARTLPFGLVINLSTIGEGEYGVFMSENLPKAATFGPYEGENITDRKPNDQSKYAWEIYQNAELEHVIDGEDESKANWMRYVQRAVTLEEQNLEAYQHECKLYFRAMRPIEAGGELFVQYGNQYTRRMMAETLRAQQDSSPEVDYRCLECNKAYFTDIVYWRHRRLVHEDPLPVEIYKKIMEEKERNKVSKKSARRQLKREEGEEEDMADREEENAESDEEENKPFKCDICQRKFKTAGSLRQHAPVHMAERPYKCEHCGKGFTQAGNLKVHMRKHTGERPFVCNICGKDFIQRNELKKHLVRHQGIKNYKCDECPKSFCDWGNLYRHKKTHSQERPFKCHICGKGFAQTSNLRTHVKRHTGEKPFKCSMCDKCFMDLAHLLTHQRRHTGEKMFFCHLCGKSFVDTQSLRSHTKRHIAKNKLRAPDGNVDEGEDCEEMLVDAQDTDNIDTGHTVDDDLLVSEEFQESTELIVLPNTT